MPTAWSKKDERMYKHIRASCLDRGGRTSKTCKRIAAATVNKQRKQEGRTLSGLGLLAVHPISRADKDILRLSMIAELDAVSLYEQLAKKAKDKKVREILLDVAKEEKTHVGEFQAKLRNLDPEYARELIAGSKEAGFSELEPGTVQALKAWSVPVLFLLGPLVILPLTLYTFLSRR